MSASSSTAYQRGEKEPLCWAADSGVLLRDSIRPEDILGDAA